MFTSTPNSLSARLHSIYVLTQYIIIVNKDQELMCSIQFQSFLIFSDPPDGIFLSKVSKQWRYDILEQRWKAMAKKHLLVSGHSEQTMHRTDFYITQTLLQVSYKHILNILYNYMNIQNSVRILLTESRAFSDATNKWYTVPLYEFHYIFSA
jgi:hypothetical protein